MIQMWKLMTWKWILMHILSQITFTYKILRKKTSLTLLHSFYIYFNPFLMWFGLLIILNHFLFLFQNKVLTWICREAGIYCPTGQTTAPSIFRRRPNFKKNLRKKKDRHQHQHKKRTSIVLENINPFPPRKQGTRGREPQNSAILTADESFLEIQAEKDARNVKKKAVEDWKAASAAKKKANKKKKIDSAAKKMANKVSSTAKSIIVKNPPLISSRRKAVCSNRKIRIRFSIIFQSF